MLHAAEEIVIDGHNTRSASPGVPVVSIYCHRATVVSKLSVGCLLVRFQLGQFHCRPLLFFHLQGSRTVQPGSRIEQRSSDGNIPQRRRAAAQENEVEVIDLTSSSPELEIVSSTVVPAPKEVKRPRLSPGKQQLVAHAVQQQLAAAQAPPPPTAPESPKGPKCGICLELMGGNSSKQMWAPSCG